MKHNIIKLLLSTALLMISCNHGYSIDQCSCLEQHDKICDPLELASGIKTQNTTTYSLLKNCWSSISNSITNKINSFSSYIKNSLNVIPKYVSNCCNSTYRFVNNGFNTVKYVIDSTYNFLYNFSKPISSVVNPSNLSSKPVKILSLDGGGTRGYVQAKFLELFCKDAGISNLGEYFDLIAGTSVGGINAVAFASGMTPKNMIDFFREKTPWIFTVRSITDMFDDETSIPSNKPNIAQMMYMITGKMDPFYKSVSENSNYGNARLRKEITNIYGDKLLTTINKPLLLTAHNSSSNTPIVFTNTKIKNISETFNNIKIVDALMATTSAPNYFLSTSLKLTSNGGYQDIIDGSLFQDDPSILALTSAHSLYPSAKEYCILSLGTGMKQIKLNINDKTELQLSQYIKLLEVVMQNAQITNNILLNELNNNKQYNTSYYKFNIQLDNNIDCSFDTSTSEFFDYLDTAVTAKYQEDKDKIAEFISKLQDFKNKQ